jgi:hypothetical protein
MGSCCTGVATAVRSTAISSGRRNEDAATHPRLMLAASQSSAKASRFPHARSRPCAAASR